MISDQKNDFEMDQDKDTEVRQLNKRGLRVQAV